jgi:hypothetical protein
MLLQPDERNSLMGRKIFIVAAENRAMYESLSRSLAGERDVEVIYDRRQSKRKDEPRRSGSIWSRGPLSELGERRVPSHVEEDLRTRGWAVVRMNA